MKTCSETFDFNKSISNEVSRVRQEVIMTDLISFRGQGENWNAETHAHFVKEIKYQIP